MGTRAWALAVLVAAVLLAYGGVWTRGVQGDDLCMCELATANGYWDAVRLWLENWNGRLFLALSQLGTYHVGWFARPLQAPWFAPHAAVVLAHLSVCVALFALMARAGLTTGAALTAALVMAVHPLGFESVLWLAAAYGYVFGTLLTLLAIWCFLEFERTRRAAWLCVAAVLTLAAVMGIEQFLMVLGALAALHLFRARRSGTGRPGWLPLAIVACCALAFAAVHFALYPSTGRRIAMAATNADQLSGPGSLWKLAWSLSVVPGASPYGGLLGLGLAIVREHVALLALVALTALVAGWRLAARGTWRETRPANQPAARHGWLIAAGLVAFSAAMLPFAFTGRYSFGLRNLYAALPGLLVAGGAVLDLIARGVSAQRAMRPIVATSMALFVGLSLVMDIGAQGMFARSWWFHRDLIHTIEAEADSIRASGALRVTGIPRAPYKAISQIDSSWAFPCLVRWVVRDEEVRAWNNLMPDGPRAAATQGGHHIRWVGF